MELINEVLPSIGIGGKLLDLHISTCSVKAGMRESGFSFHVNEPWTLYSGMYTRQAASNNSVVAFIMWSCCETI